MNRASVLLLATAFALGGGLWWFFSRTSASGETRALPPTPSPVAARAESPSVGASVAGAERESVPAPAAPAVADETPHVPIPDPNKPFDLVDGIDWHLDQMRQAREKGDTDRELACCNILWGMCVGAILDERGESIQREPGFHKVASPRADEERFSFNNRDYSASEGEFPEFVSYVRWQRSYYGAQGDAARIAATHATLGEQPETRQKVHVPDEYTGPLNAVMVRARAIGMGMRARSAAPR